MAALAAHPAVEDDAGDLAALARPGAVAEEVAHPVNPAFGVGLERTPPILRRVAAGQVAGVRACSVDQGLKLGGREHAIFDETRGNLRDHLRDRRGDRAHRDRFDERGRVIGCPENRDSAGPVRQVMPDLFGDRRWRGEWPIGDRQDRTGG